MSDVSDVFRLHWVKWVDLLHKFHSAPFCVHISVTEWYIVGYLSDALWDLWDELVAVS